MKRHDIDTGFTWMGIQTAAYEDNTFYFGIYGSKGDPSGVIACPDDLSSYKRYTCGGSVGILKLDGAYYVGSTPTDKKTGRRTGYLTRQKEFPDKPFTLARTGKGELRLFFEGRDTSGWKDAGYVFNNNGNKPLFSRDTLFVSAKAAKKCKEFPAVGIGGDKEFYTPDLVRGVHRAALHGDTYSLHLPGTPETLKDTPALAAAVDAVTREAKRLGVKVVGR